MLLRLLRVAGDYLIHLGDPSRRFPDYIFKSKILPKAVKVIVSLAPGCAVAGIIRLTMTLTVCPEGTVCLKVQTMIVNQY